MRAPLLRLGRSLIPERANLAAVYQIRTTGPPPGARLHEQGPREGRGTPHVASTRKAARPLAQPVAIRGCCARCAGGRCRTRTCNLLRVSRSVLPNGQPRPSRPEPRFPAILGGLPKCRKRSHQVACRRTLSRSLPSEIEVVSVITGQILRCIHTLPRFHTPAAVTHVSEVAPAIGVWRPPRARSVRRRSHEGRARGSLRGRRSDAAGDRDRARHDQRCRERTLAAVTPVPSDLCGSRRMQRTPQHQSQRRSSAPGASTRCFVPTHVWRRAVAW